MRDKLALWLIRCARRLTTFGFTDDHLSAAEDSQRGWLDHLADRTRPTTDEGSGPP